MAQTTIRFRIRPDGRVEELVEGIAGEGCESLTRRIESRLGAVQHRRATTEAFSTQQEGRTVALAQQLGRPA